MPEPAATCTACGFRWYGATAADGLRVLGHCIHCRGEVQFAERPVGRRPAPLEGIDPRLAPHQVMGRPRVGD
jgi:hypothetical protein